MQPSTRTKLKSRPFGPALSALACGALLLLGGSCTQPTMNCTTAHLTYGAKYELTSGDPNSPCGQHKGDILGMQTYFEPGGLNGTPKFNEPSAAIRTQYAGLILDNALNYPEEVPGFTGMEGVEHMANALAEFDRGQPNDDDFCTIDKMAPAVVDLPELPLIPGTPAVVDDPNTPEDETAEEVPEVPATPPKLVRHEWSNVRWLVNPDAQGTQFEADLKFTEDGCTAEYHVVAVSPAIPCMTDDDCTKAGSGLNPDFAVRCDPEIKDLIEPGLGLCVLSEAIPSYED